MREPLESRFWKKVRKGREDECWEWLAHKNNKGYGMMRPGGSAPQKLASRLSLEMKLGSPIPEGMIAQHKCDNPPCVNPKHLELGTMKTNYHDMVKKGRRVLGRDPNCTPPRFEGEGHPCSKLTTHDVKNIRRLYEAGGTYRGLGRQFCVSKTQIKRICLYQSWSQVD